MTPGGRIQAAIGVLDAVLDGAPAEKALTSWARSSRFAGSKDRASVRDHVFQVLRCRRSYAALGGGLTGRALMIGALRAAGEDPSELFNGMGYAPAPLTDTEGLPTTPSDADRFDLPDWLISEFIASLGDRAQATALALQERAPIMLRVNLARSTRAAAVKALADEGISTVESPAASSALVVTKGARQVARSNAYLVGIIELQDGSSQAAMEELQVSDGSKVLDYCAGGGGKTLALASRAKALWFAHDAASQRMTDLPSRAERAGSVVELLSKEEAAQTAPFDLVLCDAPCSGSGTWRRAPDAKWVLTPERLAELAVIQAEILRTAAQLVAVDGCLAYATCSVLQQENANQIKQFLHSRPEWRVVSEQVWPVSKHGDGFYLAVLRREDR